MPTDFFLLQLHDGVAFTQGFKLTRNVALTPLHAKLKIFREYAKHK